MENGFDTCKVCGNQIKKGVNRCQHCGAKQGNVALFFSIAAVCVVAVIVLLFIQDNSSEQSTIGGSPPPIVLSTPSPLPSKNVEITSVGTAALIQAYADNEINANELYLDKVLEISGIINSIGIDILDQSYVTVGDGSGTFLDTVHCNLADTQAISPSSLKEGSTITIRGTYVKNVVGVMLDDCTIISVY